MDVRPQITVDLNEYGFDGQITLEPLDFVRRKRLQNNLGRATHFKDLNMDELKSQDLGDIIVYKVMAFMTSAPFKLDSIESFYGFMARLDKNELGSADRLFNRLENEIKTLKEDSPLPQSQDSQENRVSERGCCRTV
jgi:hypothetical protein